MTGTVRSIITNKGFGFIESEKVRDYFFHITDCRTEFSDLKEGDQVEFEVIKTKKGPRASDVTKI